MNGSAGLLPGKKLRQEISVSRKDSQNFQAVCADPAAGLDAYIDKGATDAEILAKEFYPVFEAIDIVNLPRYTMYLKLMIDGASSMPFSAKSLC